MELPRRHKNRLVGAAVTFVLIDHVLVQSDGRCNLLAGWASWLGVG